MMTDSRKAYWAPALLLALIWVQFGLRLLIGPTLELDEAEALWHARDLALGYGPQPPLYFWLQWGVFQLTGPGIAGLALMKALVLSGTVLALWRLLRQAGVAAGAASAGVLSLGLLPEIVWEAQRALTHTTLTLFMAVLTLALAQHALRGGGWRDHVALGLALGLGMLSKANFAFLIAALALAVLARAEWRARLRPGPALMALALAGLVALPLPIFTLTAPDRALSSLHKLGAGGPSPAAAVQFLGAAGVALVSLFALAAVVLAMPFWRARRQVALPEGLRLARDVALFALGLAVLGGLASGATALKGRWLMPLLWPLAVVAVVAVWPGLTARGQRWLSGVMAAVWVVVAAALPYASLVDPGYRNADFAPLVAELAPAPRVAIAQTWVLGNLVLAGRTEGLSQWRGPVAGVAPDVVILTRKTEDDALPMPPGYEFQPLTLAHGKRQTTLLIGRRN